MTSSRGLYTLGSLLLAAAAGLGTARAHGDGSRPGMAKRADTVDVLVSRARADAARERNDEAARGFLAAARRAPAAARWLRLSALQAAGRSGDTLLARRLEAELQGDPVVPADSVRAPLAGAFLRAGATARGREVAGGLAGEAAPRLWVEHLGPAVLAGGDTARARRGYLSAATAAGAPAAAMERLLELDPSWDALAAGGRADLRESRGVRGRRLLARALEAAPESERAGLALELAEARLAAGRVSEAHRTTASWLDRDGVPPPVRARLELVAARTHFRRGQTREGEVHLRRATAAAGGEPSARAAYLLAERAHDRGDTAAARSRYRTVGRGFGDTRYGGLARMRLGFLALADERWSAAAEHFRSYREDRTGGGWHTASLYWEGRAREAAGDRSGARDLYRRVWERDPVSYYGMLAADRSEGAGWLAFLEARTGDGRESGDAAGGREGSGIRGPSAGRPPADAGGPDRLDGLLRRMDRLRGLGWRDRALRELEVARRHTGSLAGGPLRLARRLHAEQWTEPGIGLGWQAFQEAGGRWSRPLLEAVFPLPYASEVRRVARARGVDAALVAAVARQESAFDPGAVSPAGAVGLMQLMPATARQLARAGGRTPPDTTELRDREVSLSLGTRYLADLLDRFDGSRAAALIAYNAGPHRYERWRRYPEFGADPELLVERIPFAETRRYVKAVLRNTGVYRRLYALGGP